MLGFAFVMLNETLRVYFIDVALSKAWLFQGLTAIPTALYLFVLAFTVAAVMRSAMNRKIVVALLFAIAVLFPFLIRPGLDNLFASSLKAMSRFDYPQLYFEPFPLKIFVPIYVGYLEPVIATFVLAWLVWPGMTCHYKQRLVRFTVTILLLKNRIIPTLLWSFWIPGRLGKSMLSEGQFSLEVLVLGLLTGIAWQWLLSDLQVARLITYSEFEDSHSD